jgi:hypothetical protein
LGGLGDLIQSSMSTFSLRDFDIHFVFEIEDWAKLAISSSLRRSLFEIEDWMILVISPSLGCSLSVLEERVFFSGKKPKGMV